jgi:hypothetical protein
MTNPSPTTPAAAPIDELHVHDWSPWGPSPLSESLGIERHRRMCFSCQLYQDEPTPELRETPLGLVPESAISAAADALVGEESGYCGPGYGTCGSLHVSREHAAELARAALAAAVPHIERAIRDRIADEIEAEGSKFLVEARRDSYRSAARVARGGEATE